MDPEWDPYHEKRITLGGLVDRVDTIKRGRRIMFVACGTSYHACLACRQTMEELAELPVRLDTHFAQMHDTKSVGLTNLMSSNGAALQQCTNIERIGSCYCFGL